MKQTHENGQTAMSTNTPVFTSDQLERALASVEHTMSCLPIDFFLLEDLANYIHRNEADMWLVPGSVDTITIGVKRQWITPTVENTLHTIVPTLGSMPNEWQWEAEGVPVRVSIVDRNYSFFQNLDFKFHFNSEYKIPNPFQKYWVSRYLVK